MAASRRTASVPAMVALTALASLPLLAAPPLIRGLAARAWVSHYAALPSLPRPRRASARALVEKANQAIESLAPLPQASDAAIRALEIGERTEHRDQDREAALVIYAGVRSASARVRSRPLSGAGFAVIEARATALESAARSDAAK